jgi:hypothetical protein
VTQSSNDPTNPHDGHPRNPDEDRFRDGFIDGFTRAREIFWRDLMRKAGECKLMAETTDSQSLKDNLSAMEAAYRVSADLISRSHTVYPGALTPDADQDDPRYTVKFDNNLFRY